MDRGGATSAGSADPPAKDRPKGHASEEGSNADGPKCCTDCRTTKTPLWRGGPSGPKSLCNACGIRYRKRRREMLGLKSRSVSDKVRKEKLADHGSSAAAKVSVVRKKRPRSLLWLKRRRRRQLGEEEQAAILLMALSTGFLYA